MTSEQLAKELQTLIKGDVVFDDQTLDRMSHDMSIFEMRPKIIVYPKDETDVSIVVRFVKMKKATGEDISITARAAGSDMSGGVLSTGVVLVYTKYMNQLKEVGVDFAIVEPGMFYRDFDAETKKHDGLILPSFPASREICALGGMINNNSGGELNLRYGKTDRYVHALSVTLSDGSSAEFKKITLDELEQKKTGNGFEAQIYRDMHRMLKEHKQEIENSTPTVTKNSAGYALWDVLDEERGTFDLARLLVGAQGTLALVNEAKVGLVKPKPRRAMMVAFVHSLKDVPEVMHRILPLSPESCESYDENTLKLALRFFPELFKQLGFMNMLKLGFSFIPELLMFVRGGAPDLIIMVEFAEDTDEEALRKARAAAWSLRDLNAKTEVINTALGAKKFWTIRRESFALLRKNPKGLKAAPFIDDFVVHVDDLPHFLPELITLLSPYKLTFTIAGHVGDGNFHIIPLMNLADPKSHDIIIELSQKVYALVHQYHGSITGEHNDGIIRTPYLPMMFTPAMLELFAQTKHIFDPQNILNPGKKVGGTIADIKKYMMSHK
ncbi:MAG TPA: FAD-binding oxidoreductase [Candidatus Paceibacterota bacterium]|nr:FAD-binding oxidoreductase [Candidatus Paceibacterota bacterium]